MSYCPGSNRPPEYSSRGVRKITTHVKRQVDIGTEIQLRRIIREEFGLDYDELKTNEPHILLRTDGMTSAYLIRGRKIRTLKYIDGREKYFLISSS